MLPTLFSNFLISCLCRQGESVDSMKKLYGNLKQIYLEPIFDLCRPFLVLTEPKVGTGVHYVHQSLWLHISHEANEVKFRSKKVFYCYWKKEWQSKNSSLNRSTLETAWLMASFGPNWAFNLQNFVSEPSTIHIHFILYII